jgi:hypothetical protein
MYLIIDERLYNVVTLGDLCNVQKGLLQPLVKHALPL